MPGTHTADKRAADLVEAADNGSDEGHQAKRLAIGELRQVDRRDEDGGNGRQRTVDEEGVEHHALDIDAEDLRDIRVLRRRLHGAAGAAAAGHLDELFQSELWGEDVEATARRKQIGRELASAETFLGLLLAES